MKTTMMLGAVLLFGLSTAACSASTSSTGSASSAASADDFCSELCTRKASCDSSVDHDSCMSECDDAAGTTIARLRSDLVDAMSSCMEEADCKTVLSSGGLDDCIGEAAASAAPDQAAKDACHALGDTFDRCDASGFDAAGCFEHMKIYNDGVLKAVTKCASKSCGAVADCVNAALGTESGGADGGVD